MFLLLLHQFIWIWCVYLMVFYLLHASVWFVPGWARCPSLVGCKARFGEDPGNTTFFLYICVLILYILHFVLYCTIYLSHTSPWLMLLVISCHNTKRFISYLSSTAAHINIKGAILISSFYFSSLITKECVLEYAICISIVGAQVDHEYCIELVNLAT